MSLWLRKRELVVLAAALAAALPICAGVAVAQADPAAAPAAAAPLSDRFRVEVGEDGIELTPIARDSAVESIELLDGEDEALVNGKRFSRQELEAFLGADGREIAALLDLSDRERRARLGVGAEEEEELVDEGEPDEVIGGLPRPPRPPRPPHIHVQADEDDHVSFGDSIEIEEGDSAGDAVCIGCSITVKGQLEGDAVAVGGRVELYPGAVVEGNVVSVGGRVDVAAGAVVNGDAVAVGGRVHVEEGGVVEGQKSSVGWGAAWFGGPSRGFMPIDFSGDVSDFFWSMMRTLLLCLVAMIVVLFVREPVERTARRLLDEPWKALFAGLLAQLLFFPVLVLATVILAVSIIGIPLLVLVPVAVLAFVLAMLIGYVAVAQSLGRWTKVRFAPHLSEPFLTVIVGVVLLQAATLLGRLVSIPGGVFGIIGFTLLCLGFFLKYVGWTIGLGGMVLSMLARDWRRPSPMPPLAPMPPATPRTPPPAPMPPVEGAGDDRPSAVPPPTFGAASSDHEITESVEEDVLRRRDTGDRLD